MTAWRSILVLTSYYTYSVTPAMDLLVAKNCFLFLVVEQWAVHFLQLTYPI